jgi:hypothetical protein
MKILKWIQLVCYAFALAILGGTLFDSTMWEYYAILICGSLGITIDGILTLIMEDQIKQFSKIIRKIIK